MDEWNRILFSPESVEWRRIVPRAWRVVGFPTYADPWNQQCVWYRVFDGIEEDTDLFCSDEEARLEDALRFAMPSRVLLHRVVATPFFERLVSALRKSNSLVQLDIDDQVFDKSVLGDPLLNLLSAEVRNEFSQRIAAQRGMLGQVDEVILSTPELVEAASPESRRVTLRLNRIPRFYSLFDDPRFSCLRLAVGETDRFRIYYGPGTLDHLLHLRLIQMDVLDFLRAHESAQLVLGGGIRIADAEDLPSGRIVHLPKVLPEIYFSRLRCYDVILAPLHDGPFSRAKSWIKPLEAAVQGVPFVCSRVPNYERLVAQIGIGALCSEDGEWRDALERLCADRVASRSRAIEWALAERERYIS